MPKTILIVEDHDQVRAALCDWLKVVFRDWTILEARTGQDAIALVRSQPPELILMDIELEQMNGIEATRAIHVIAPQSCVVMLTIHEEAEYQVAAAAAGACGFVVKRKMHTELVPVMSALLSQASGAAFGELSRAALPPTPVQASPVAAA